MRIRRLPRAIRDVDDRKIVTVTVFLRDHIPMDTWFVSPFLTTDCSHSPMRFGDARLCVPSAATNGVTDTF